jgi:hypothetical protein
MFDESLPYQLKTGRQLIKLSDLKNAEIIGVQDEHNLKISRFLNILADDILCMRDDVKSYVFIDIVDDVFSICIDHSYPFLEFLNSSNPVKINEALNGVDFLLNLNLSIDLITPALLAIFLDELKADGWYKFNDDDERESETGLMEQFIHINALDTFYVFDIIDQALGYDGTLSKRVKNNIYHVMPFSEEDEFSMFEFRNFNSNNIEMTLTNHDFYIKVINNTIRFEYLYDSMEFNLNKKHPVAFNIKKFTQFFLSFYNIQHDTDHDDLPRWIKLQEMIAI